MEPAGQPRAVQLKGGTEERLAMMYRCSICLFDKKVKQCTCRSQHALVDYIIYVPIDVSKISKLSSYVFNVATDAPGRFVQKYVEHLEQALRSKQQDFLEVAREKRQLELQIKRQPPEARFGDLFDGKEKLPNKLRVHLYIVEGCGPALAPPAAVG